MAEDAYVTLLFTDNYLRGNWPPYAVQLMLTPYLQALKCWRRRCAMVAQQKSWRSLFLPIMHIAFSRKPSDNSRFHHVCIGLT